MNNIEMKRGTFLRRLMQIVILAVMSLVVLALGDRVVTGRDCNKCPGQGICSGEIDCESYQ